ncbi:hypothetical protein WKR88_04955 [Trinickia caryophylli]|uniref:Preprotein translocase subunit SecA n=1 Tax=Trinickia caryophylli TaxID=28094 RepID=A0A1X7FB23_TRICW|nr:hypothetical protein [Trinickia caryophylli]PMS10910.1 hypothetical protein C0Z17_17165 [Trinickia caryophylli]TRX18852.1 hypothetical protein FNF07_11870 [Trinickia caryophylli]WQE10350.1 hypothetical protein U0034_11045 [Trinickia caryophylli]SMF49481.1 hypothetical protein SAMN06295900_108161 [Trinickia caryophylli]GLU34203.1 hypothetical protein Busp01_40450 [Trinickia caryophylli]
MLSLHELAALILLEAALDRGNLDLADIETLLAQELVTLEPLPCGREEPRLTSRGASMVASLTRVGRPRTDFH